jgi:hypothetical protein
MKVRTKIRFREKDDFKVVHEIGSEFECNDERGKYLIDLGFVEKVKEAPKAEPKVEQPKAEKGKKKAKPFVDDTDDNIEGK